MTPYVSGTILYNYFMYLFSALSLTINLLKSSIKTSLPCYCSSGIQPCPTVWEPMGCSTPGLPAPGHKVCPVYVHCKVMPSTILSLSTLFFCPQSFQESGTFPMSRLFTSDDLLSSTPPLFPLLSPKLTIVPATQHIFRNVYWINQYFHVACILDIILIFFLIWPLQKWNLTSYLIFILSIWGGS